jgi:hypothetical protein
LRLDALRLPGIKASIEQETHDVTVLKPLEDSRVTVSVDGKRQGVIPRLHPLLRWVDDALSSAELAVPLANPIAGRANP